MLASPSTPRGSDAPTQIVYEPRSDDSGSVFDRGLQPDREGTMFQMIIGVQNSEKLTVCRFDSEILRSCRRVNAVLELDEGDPAGRWLHAERSRDPPSVNIVAHHGDMDIVTGGGLKHTLKSSRQRPALRVHRNDNFHTRHGALPSVGEAVGESSQNGSFSVFIMLGVQEPCRLVSVALQCCDTVTCAHRSDRLSKGLR